jgi:hypothetical protein
MPNYQRKSTNFKIEAKKILILLFEFLDEIQTKVLRFFLLAIHNHLYSFALRFIFHQTYATSYSF